MKDVAYRILSSSYLFLIPILLWNVIFASKLTSVGYRVDQVDLGFLKYFELVLRIGVFALPLWLTFDVGTPHFQSYLLLYAIGCLLYFVSWLLIIYWPDLAITKSWLVQLGPAYLPLIFLLAIAFLSHSKIFGILSLAFIIIHVTNTFLSLKGLNL